MGCCPVALRECGTAGQGTRAHFTHSSLALLAVFFLFFRHHMQLEPCRSPGYFVQNLKAVKTSLTVVPGERSWPVELLFINSAWRGGPSYLKYLGS